MKKNLLLLFSILFTTMGLYAQNFGIGTNNPGEKLTVYKNGPVAFRLNNDSGTFRIGVANAASQYGLTNAGDVMLQNYSNKGLAFGTNGDNVRMYINNAGNIGFGTTAPTVKLHINAATSPAFRLVDGTQAVNRVLTSDANGNASWQAPVSSYWSLSGNIGTTAGTNFLGTTDAQNLVLKTAGTTRMVFDQNYTAIGGSGNTVTTSNIASTANIGSFVMGSGNTVAHNAQIVSGSGNIDSAQNTIITGSTNSISAGSGSVNGNGGVIMGGIGNTVGGNTDSYGTIVTGNSNTVIGAFGSAVFGSSNIDSSKNSLVFGSGNNLSTGTLGGSTQTNRGTILGGGGNVVSGISYNSMINGSQNTLTGASFENIVGGYQNGVNASQKMLVTGQWNTANNSVYGIINGISNTVAAAYSLLVGNANNVSSDYGYALGISNTINTGATYGFVLGQGNTIAANHNNALIIGRNATSTTANQLTANFSGGYQYFIAATGNTTAATPAMVIAPTTGNVGIGATAPTTKLHINSASSPAFRLVDGTQAANSVLTSDASGNASWQPVAANVITGSLPASGPTITTNNVNTYTSANITLPPGKWMVNLGTTAQMSGTNIADAQYWLGLYLCDGNVSFASTSDIITGLTGVNIRGAISRGMQVGSVNGVLAVNNTSGGNKTYYVWAVKATIGGTPTALDWNNITGNVNAERYFYAVRFN